MAGRPSWWSVFNGERICIFCRLKCVTVKGPYMGWDTRSFNDDCDIKLNHERLQNGPGFQAPEVYRKKPEVNFGDWNPVGAHHVIWLGSKWDHITHIAITDCYFKLLWTLLIFPYYFLIAQMFSSTLIVLFFSFVQFKCYL